MMMSQRWAGYLIGNSGSARVNPRCTQREGFENSQPNKNGLLPAQKILSLNYVRCRSYKVILEKVKRKKIADPTMKIIRSYLEDRKIVIKDGTHISVNSGVRQGSVNAALLWNNMYDGILRIGCPGIPWCETNRFCRRLGGNDHCQGKSP